MVSQLETSYWPLVGGEARDAAKYPAMHEAAAATETYPIPNVQNADGAKVEKCFLK